MLNRRQTFTGFALAFGAVSFGLTTTATAQSLTWAPTALTPTQARTVDAAAELIVPATDTPGARAVGVPQFIDRALGGWCDPAQAKLLREGLDGLDADAKAANGAPFADLTAAQQTALLMRYDDVRAPQRRFMALLRS